MQELNRFKREINLAEFAQLYGYYIDKEKSSRAVKQLRNDQTGDKIVVSKNEKNGHYIYFSMKDYDDNGTIVDFIQRRTGKNLGQVRKECRAYLRGEIDTRKIDKVKLVASSSDRPKLERIWDSISNNFIIEDIRGIDAILWNEVVKKDRVKIKDGKLYFKLLDVNGICGISTYDTHTKEKRLIKGSQKGLWSFGNLKNAKYVVFVESPIDALSYKQLYPKIGNNGFFVATMGNIGENEKLSIREIARRLNDEQEIIIGMDKDEAGEKMALDIKNEIVSANRALKENIYRHTPQNGKDWNDELNHSIERSSHIHLHM